MHKLIYRHNKSSKKNFSSQHRWHKQQLFAVCRSAYFFFLSLRITAKLRVKSRIILCQRKIERIPTENSTTSAWHVRHAGGARTHERTSRSRVIGGAADAADYWQTMDERGCQQGFTAATLNRRTEKHKRTQRYENKHSHRNKAEVQQWMGAWAEFFRLLNEQRCWRECTQTHTYTYANTGKASTSKRQSVNKFTYNAIAKRSRTFLF